ncbi:MAG: DUF952 domain-containing protein [Erysipelotrichaceae bacterium]|nr:DUF952 domain-containing protein [Erysipelotrichaceae bacterium]
MIFHVCRKEVWEKEKESGYFGKQELETYGLIHSSEKEGLKKILSRFTETEEYIVLYINEDPVRDKIFYEEKDKEKLYPHFHERIDIGLIEKTEPLKTFIGTGLKEEER